MKTLHYIAATLIASAFTASAVDKESRIVSKGRSGFVTKQVVKEESRDRNRHAVQENQRARTIGVSIGEPDKERARRGLAGGRSAPVFRATTKR